MVKQHFYEEIMTHFVQNGVINGGLKTSEKKAVSVILENLDESAAKMVERLGLGKRTVERALARLQGLGMIERIGSKRDGRWIVIK